MFLNCNIVFFPTPKPHSDQCMFAERDQICLQESSGEEGLSPSEALCKESPEAVDLQCMVDLPCSIFKETVGGADILLGSNEMLNFDEIIFITHFRFQT